MKKVTQQFKNNIRTFGRQLDTKVTFNGTTLNNDVLNEVIPHFNAGLFKTIMKGVEIDSNVSIPKNSVINVQSGILVNKEYEYVDYGNYLVYKEPKIDEDTKSYKIIAYDKIIESMIDYDLGITYPITIRDMFINIFNRLNWDLSGIPNVFTNSSKKINRDLYSGIDYTFRDVLDELCTVTCQWLVDKDGKPTLIEPGANTEVIDETYLNEINVTMKEKVFFNSLVFSRAGNSDNIFRKDDNSILVNGLHEFRISDNQLLSTNDRDIYIEQLWNKLKNFQYYVFDIETVGIMFLEPIDAFKLKIRGIEYPTILLNDKIDISQGLTEHIFSDKPKESETDYKKADTTDRKINQTYIIVDKQNQTIEAVIKNVEGQNSKISKVEQDLGEIKQSISEIADITTSGETSYATLDLSKVNESEPIYIKIRPLTEDISYLYPRTNLYPSPTLYLKNRILRFYNKTTKETFNYTLPIDLLVLDTKVYDDLVIDYDLHSVTVTKRVKQDSQGNKTPLPSPKIFTSPYPSNLKLTKGDYTISVVGYDTAYLSVRLMAENIYTTQFATKVEMSSAINQTATEINSSVDKKLYGLNETLSSDITQSANEINLSVERKIGETNNKIDNSNTSLNNKIDTTDKNLNNKIDNNEKNIKAELKLKLDTKNLVSELNASANDINITGNRILIKSDSFELSKNGKIDSTGGKIGGWHITGNSLYSYIIPPQDYKQGDTERLQKILIDQDHGRKPTQQEMEYFDTNNDGILDILDLLHVQKLILHGFLKSNPGKIVFDTTDWFRPIKVYNSYGEIINSFNAYGKDE